MSSDNKMNYLPIKENQLSSDQKVSLLNPEDLENLHNEIMQSKNQKTIWVGEMKWQEYVWQCDINDKINDSICKTDKKCLFRISATVIDGEPEIKADSWPTELILLEMPERMLRKIPHKYLKNSKKVFFYSSIYEAYDSVVSYLTDNITGIVHSSSSNSNTSNVDYFILQPSENRTFLGIIPNNQSAFKDYVTSFLEKTK